MKTTSYEISKKLYEAEFKARNDGIIIDKSGTGTYGSFGLETIISALPALVEESNKQYWFWLWNDGVGYYQNYHNMNHVYNMDDGIHEFSIDSINQSLVDCAARLWLKLREQNLV